MTDAQKPVEPASDEAPWPKYHRAANDQELACYREMQCCLSPLETESVLLRIAAEIAARKQENDDNTRDYLQLRDDCDKALKEAADLRMTLTAEIAARIGAEECARGWEQTALQHCRNEDYYRSLVEVALTHFGDIAYLCDDGSVSESPLCAKLPELVTAMQQQLTAEREHVKALELGIVAANKRWTDERDRSEGRVYYESTSVAAEIADGGNAKTEGV